MKNLKESDFREGLSITCKIEGTKIDDAKLHFEYGYWHVCQNIEDGLGCDNKLGYKCSWMIDDCNDVTDIQIKHRTIDDLEEGDIIEREDDDKRKVLGICGKVYFVSYYDNFYEASDTTHTIEELKKEGYKLVQPEEEETILTMSEVAELAGVDVKHLKIKK